MTPDPVEALAAALRPHFGPSYFPGLHDVTIIGKSPEEVAATLLAALAAAGYRLVPAAPAAEPPQDFGEQPAYPGSKSPIPVYTGLHEQGEPHRYRIECEVCGERGTVQLTIEPQVADGRFRSAEREAQP